MEQRARLALPVWQVPLVRSGHRVIREQMVKTGRLVRMARKVRLVQPDQQVLVVLPAQQVLLDRLAPQVHRVKLV